VRKNMVKYLIILSLVANLALASGTTKLVDYVISSSGVVELLTKYGIKNSDAQMVKGYLGSALASLNSGKKTLTREEFQKVLSTLPVTGSDANVRMGLQKLLDTPEAQIQKKDVINVINNIIYLANRHGKSVIITCADCVNESLAKEGFKFTVETVKNSKSADLLKNVIPSNPGELNQFVSARMRRLGMGDYSKVTPDLVAPTEEKSLALFLALAESGSKEQKDFIAAIKKVSTTNGKVNIIDPKNPHKFWRELADDMSPETMKGWTQTLNDVAERRAKDGVSAEEAFYRTLKDKADANPELKKQYETLKSKRCFFK
jgi:predicted Zn-ribbon and HTH transcriptional regulator